jgi:hypothetical protein
MHVAIKEVLFSRYMRFEKRFRFGSRFYKRRSYGSKNSHAVDGCFVLHGVKCINCSLDTTLSGLETSMIAAIQIFV